MLKLEALSIVLLIKRGGSQGRKSILGKGEESHRDMKECYVFKYA